MDLLSVFLLHSPKPGVCQHFQIYFHILEKGVDTEDCNKPNYHPNNYGFFMQKVENMIRISIFSLNGLSLRLVYSFFRLLAAVTDITFILHFNQSGLVKKKHLSQCMRFPTMCHFDKCRLRRACAASFEA